MSTRHYDWVIEQTFSWLGQAPRLAKEYERLPGTEESTIYETKGRLMLIIPSVSRVPKGTKITIYL